MPALTTTAVGVSGHRGRGGGGVPMGKNDVWIAATAHVTGARLLTTDRDFDHLDPTFLGRDWVDPAAA